MRRRREKHKDLVIVQSLRKHFNKIGWKVGRVIKSKDGLYGFRIDPE